ncbi:MAG: DNA repair exonuclease [Candidatus Cloacimonadota bacterium]|nr:MAG: DNA repair exonuclease [Candidatus Cloacimonadota bacterium]
MKILHTADIHLQEYGDERWRALESLIEIGKKEKVDIFIIAGDLFNKGVSAENLRGKIRTLFSNTGFKIYILPGNHDKDSYKPGLFFGADVKILEEEPSDIQDIRIIGLPFEEIKGEEILQKVNSLKKKLKKEGINILVFHGELLDSFYSRADFGEEGSKRYMPLRLSYFDELSINYILAGHFHTNFDVIELKNGGYFVYPGSPISITKRETGRRMVNIFELKNPPSEYPLDTPYFEALDIELDPLEDESPVEKIEAELKRLPQNSKVLLKVRGYFNARKIGLTETSLIERIKKICIERCAGEPEFEFRDIQAILEDDLFKEFLKKLEQKDFEEGVKRGMRNIAIKAMMEGMS